MSTFKRFEDIEAWQLAKKLNQLVYSYIGREPFCRDFELRDQWKASTGSIMDNIAEGFCRGNNAEFIYFLGISRGSCGESQSQSYRALYQNYISEEEFKEVYTLADHISGKIANLISYLRRTDLKEFRKK